jgi:hypothetical protein
VLLRRIGHDIRMVGRATRDGYYLYADVPTDLLEESTREALYRLKNGEGHLAVSSLCGTNLAVAGALAGAASLITMGGAHNRTERLPNVILASISPSSPRSPSAVSCSATSLPARISPTRRSSA